ncbi:MAG: hypothetical protein Q9226_008132, partial [Calogaya cf. arnoldii]
TPPIAVSPASKAYPYGLPILVLTELDAVVYDPSGKEVASTVTTVQVPPGTTGAVDDGGKPYLRNTWNEWTEAERTSVIAGVVVAVVFTMGMLLWCCCRSRAWGKRGERKRRRSRMRERGGGNREKSGRVEMTDESPRGLELESDPGGKAAEKEVEARNSKRVGGLLETSVSRGSPDTIREDLNGAPADRGREPGDGPYRMSGALQVPGSPAPTQIRGIQSSVTTAPDIGNGRRLTSEIQEETIETVMLRIVRKRGGTARVEGKSMVNNTQSRSMGSDRRPRSVGQPPFPGGTYQPAGFQRNGQYPEKGQRPTGRRKFDEFGRRSYPTHLPSVAVPRGQDAFEGPGWKRDSMAHNWCPRSPSRTPRGHMPPMSMPQPREAAYLNPDFPKQRLGTPMNPASEGSHLISALDTESLHENRNQGVERADDGARSFQSAEDRHDDRSSTNDRRGSDHGSRQGSWSGRSSGNNSLRERSHPRALSQDSARANAGVSTSYDVDGQKGDGDNSGSPGATQGVDDTNGHQRTNEAHNETW